MPCLVQAVLTFRPEGQERILTFFRLLNHITSEDVAFGEFLRTKEGRSA